MKKILSLCLAIVTLFSCVCIVNATGNVVSSENSDFAYKVIDGEAWLTDYTGTATELTFPTTLDGYKVVGIADSSLCNNKNVVSLTIPGTIKTIGQMSMSSWKSLEKVVFEEGVETIGWESFFGCKALAEVDLPESLRKIDVFAFHNSAIYYKAWDEADALYKETRNSPLTGIYVDGWLISFAGRNDNALYNIEEGTVGISCGVHAMVDANVYSLNIPSTVKYIAPNSLSHAFSLESITVDENNPFYEAENGILYDKGKETVLTYPRGNQSDRGRFSVRK